MKSIMKFFYCSSLLLLSLFLASCITETKSSKENPTAAKDTLETAEKDKAALEAAKSAALPVKYQTANYLVDKSASEDISIAEEGKLKVGARITSTKGPQPLWDIVKRLVSLKGMNVSWASDVDKNVLVDVDINANDDFYQALDNMLRQVDFYHEIQGNTIVIKYKETRQFQIAMPFTKQTYSTGTGGDVLGSRSSAQSSSNSNVEGTIKLTSKENEFDIWENIKLNLDTILQIWTYRREGETVVKETEVVDKDAREGSRSYSAAGKTDASKDAKSEEKGAVLEDVKDKADKKVAGGQGYYLIDKPVGLITVTAPRPVMEKIDAYITSLKKSLYNQISIEAKIIEVQLNDISSIGINWTSVLKNFKISGIATYGQRVLDSAGEATKYGLVEPFVYNNSDVTGPITYLDANKTSYIKTINPGQFVSNVMLEDGAFDIFLNALNEQGDTKILSNPKISVMNGQPSLITVGRNVTYIDSIESKIDSETGIVTYTVATERVLSGVGMALTATVLGNNEVIMNLVPITSELHEPIEYRDVGNLGGTVGLPIVNVREMSTTVKVKDGEMLVIGGLISETEQTKGEFAPVLGDVPFLKYLFGWEEKQHLKRELIILLRPRII